MHLAKDMTIHSAWEWYEIVEVGFISVRQIRRQKLRILARSACLICNIWIVKKKRYNDAAYSNLIRDTV